VPQPPAACNEATGTRLGLSHLNFYLANGGLILPDFGNPESDAAAQGLFRELFKDLEIVPVPSRALLYAGGNIHCITQQEPVTGPA
jgi:agmatine deiminase